MDHNKLQNSLNDIGIADHITCLLRNLYVGQEAIVRIRHGTMAYFQTGKGVCQGCILSPCFMRNAGLMGYKLKSRLPGEI